MKFKSLVSMFLAATFGGIIAVFTYVQIAGNNEVGNFSHVASSSNPYLHLASYGSASIRDVSYPDLTFAAEKAVNCVVHVTVKTMQEGFGSLRDYFAGRIRQIPTEGFGSGVIISSDGYIVTNNHVISNSNEIEVTLNNRRVYAAKKIGADPSTDLALLKIDETDLPFLTFGDSEALRVGEWVLAVGNPFNLYSTVTAGIVSAKGRRREMLEMQTRGGVESFIQTDAAINSGNSGGALVNIRGELIGINTLIASRTGEFSGNAFAIPALIAQSVVTDLKEFGRWQRTLIGITIREIDDRFAKEQGIGLEGIYVAELTENGSAVAAGIKVGDVITSINNVPVNSLANLHEQLARFRPGDQVNVTVIRDKKTQQFTVTLRNIEGNTQILRGDASIDVLGAKFESVSEKDRRSLDIKSGVRVKDVGEGKLKELGMRNGFIITAVNDKSVNSANDILAIVNDVKPKGQILFNGVYPNGQVTLYGFVKQ